ncbi:MAG TPA: S9 family peptidase [Solirubrobacteraceae bacterium]|nr:S9 family peptidase [Solirubrobacteraceae bacterium]
MRRTLLADVEQSDGERQRLLVRSDASGTFQLSELVDGRLFELTALPEPISSAEYVPGTRRAIVGIDAGGNERGQLYELDLDQATGSPMTSLAQLRALTGDPRFVHVSAGISPDGQTLAYISNKAGGVDFDLWLCDLAGGQHRLLYAAGEYLQPGSGFSPDGRLVSVLRPGEHPLDCDLRLIDVGTAGVLTPLPHPDRAALVGAPVWVSESRFHASSNIDGDLAVVVEHDLVAGTTKPLTAAAFGAETDCVAATTDGRSVLVVENDNGANRMHVIDTTTGAVTAAVELPEAGVTNFFVMAPPKFSADGSRLYYTLTTPRRAGDVYRWEPGTGSTSRLTDSPSEVAPDTLAAAEIAEVASFDGERIPLLVYRPRSGEQRPPVVVVVHGGPEAQTMQSFVPAIQALVAAGYAVVAPNVRGSTGYGKRFAALDDTSNRLDSVRDLAAVHGRLAELGFDPDRAALWGGSYGGYMVLAGLAFQPELWAAGVDIVGISNLVTFLENTSAYRRAHREREYGSLAHDREFLIEASPLTRVDAIRAPLFVIHGRNDPRVPVSEAEQLAQSLDARGVPCELVIYEDEGHGLARLDNQLDAYPRAIAFLDQALARP